MSLLSPDALKDAGNAAFKSSQFQTAITHYTQAIEMISATQSQLDLLPSLYSNRSLCYLKTDNNTVNSYIDCQHGLTGLPTTHALYIKLALRSATTALLLSTQDGINTAIGKDATQLRNEATTMITSLLTHPDVIKSPTIEQSLIDEIKKYSLPITVPEKATKPTTTTTTTKPTTGLKLSTTTSSEVSNMTMADLQRLNQQNQAVQGGNSPAAQTAAKPPLRGVWARGGGKALSAMVSNDNNNQPIVIQSKDSIIAAIQQDKQQQQPSSTTTTTNAEEYIPSYKRKYTPDQ